MYRTPTQFLACLYGAGNHLQRFRTGKNAKKAVKELLILFPDYSIELFKKSALDKNLDQIEESVKALRKAGLPE